MYLLEFDSNGVLEKITPDAPPRMIGIYVNELHMSIEELLTNEVVEKVTEQGKIYYKIIGGNE